MVQKNWTKNWTKSKKLGEGYCTIFLESYRLQGDINECGCGGIGRRTRFRF